MKWSTDGCELVFLDSNRDYSICECNHLTNFAAIMDLSGRETNSFAKSLLTYICCGLSMIGLMLTILLISITNKKNSFSITETLAKTKNMITCNLCICLLVTDFFVIFGLDRTENKVRTMFSFSLMNKNFLNLGVVPNIIRITLILIIGINFVDVFARIAFIQNDY